MCSAKLKLNMSTMKLFLKSLSKKTQRSDLIKRALRPILRAATHQLRNAGIEEHREGKQQVRVTCGLLGGAWKGSGPRAPPWCAPSPPRWQRVRLQLNNKRSEQTLRKTFQSETLHQKFPSSWKKEEEDSERTEGPVLFITGVNNKNKNNKNSLFDAPEKCTLGDFTLISLLLLMDAIMTVAFAVHQDQ